MLAYELGRLATWPPGLRDRTPAPPPPSYAVAPGASSEATTARGGLRATLPGLLFTVPED